MIHCVNGKWMMVDGAYTWPSSWAIVNPAGKPLSITMRHDDFRHMAPTLANPTVLQCGLLLASEQK